MLTLLLSSLILPLTMVLVVYSILLDRTPDESGLAASDSTSIVLSASTMSAAEIFLVRCASTDFSPVGTIVVGIGAAALLFGFHVAAAGVAVLSRAIIHCRISGSTGQTWLVIAAVTLLTSATIWQSWREYPWEAGARLLTDALAAYPGGFDVFSWALISVASAVLILTGGFASRVEPRRSALWCRLAIYTGMLGVLSSFVRFFDYDRVEAEYLYAFVRFAVATWTLATAVAFCGVANLLRNRDALPTTTGPSTPPPKSA